MRYKYKIEITYINPITNESKEIPVQNIKSLSIDRDYEKCNMPVALLQLTLNKNLVDDMVLNVNKNRLNITLTKFNIDGDKTLEKVFSEQFTYMSVQDVNTHKEIDYSELEKSQNKGKDREDVFMDIELGIMCKKNLDNKAHFVNKILNNCSVEECVIQEFQGMDVVIEPFESTTKQTNIVIRPTETYQKLLEKLNNIDGFYSTPFRFFMDYDIAYLVSSSGVATKRQNEKFSNVSIDVRSLTGSTDPYAPGLEIDNDNSCYLVPFSVDNTQYKLNNVTSKYQNDLKAVIDVSKDVKNKNTSARSLINKLQQQKEAINKVVNRNINNVANVGNDLNTIWRELENDVKTATKVNTKIGNILDIADSEFNFWRRHKCEIGPFHTLGEALDDIFAIRGNVTDLGNIVALLPNEYDNMRSSLFSTAHKSMNFSSFLNCVMEINYNDNINGADDLCNTVISESTANIQKVNESNYNRAAGIYGTLSRKIGSTDSLIREFPDTFKMKPDGTDPSPDDPPETQYVDVDFTEAKAKIISLINDSDMSIGGTNLQDALNGCATRFNNNVITMKTTQDTSKSIANGCSGSIKNVMNTKNTLPDEFNGGASSLYSNATSTAASAKASVDNGIKLFQDNATNYSNNILDSVKTNIGSLGNLNDIGSLGVQELDTNISIDGKELLKDESKKTVAMRVPNDNVNLLKQEAAKIKLTSSVLTINKYDLDTQVFTPNKSYTVKNYDTHSNRDGNFILAWKREIYRREDGIFRLITMITLRKAD